MRQLTYSIGKSFNWVGILLGISLLTSIGSTFPARSAERVQVSLDILKRTISVNSLEAYAKRGVVNQDLAPYVQYVNPQKQALLRQILLKRLEVRPIAVSQFFNTPQAEILLRRLGQVIQTESGEYGSQPIQQALISAANDPEGITLLNVLRKFPASGVRIDLTRGLQLADDLSKLIEQSNKAIAAVNEQGTTLVANQTAAQIATLPNLRQPGSFTVNKQTIQLQDLRRNRNFKADIYLPISDNINQQTTPAPVIVISHGVGSDRETFAYLAQHLASFGLAVAVLEHPGSNAQQLQNLFAGKAEEAAQPYEFTNRPLDVKFLLDELERLSQTDPLYQGRINTQQVGVIGQSFGGYTTLALAGAGIDFNSLQKDCAAINSTWNLSLLLQCRALVLPNYNYDLQDSRVKAIIAINPIGSSVFGKDGLQNINIPVAIVAGTADTVAPALPEQIVPFTWLNDPQKYLLIMNNGTHFSTLAESQSSVPLPSSVIGPNPALARDYIKVFSVAFFKFYVADQREYQAYLTPSYIGYLSQEPLPLSLVRSLTEAELKLALERPSPETVISPTKRN
ncbi:alpha/beta hydrolase [Phormidium sp. LEGE 05292]|uniref:alpha/beta hydrolase n=1 Tax=[Phormidium] sp. LEGE 05292 TaxID=767427 RepID=UPI00187F6EDF|nr:alpha/beta hydrolase [Phormidium sp. LEGE 05292]MBE9223975.1 alpha/beta hydrolase [Phormidium sp. LEGE 05292]